MNISLNVDVNYLTDYLLTSSHPSVLDYELEVEAEVCQQTGEVLKAALFDYTLNSRRNLHTLTDRDRHKLVLQIKDAFEAQMAEANEERRAGPF